MNEYSPWQKATLNIRKIRITNLSVHSVHSASGLRLRQSNLADRSHLSFVAGDLRWVGLSWWPFAIAQACLPLDSPKCLFYVFSFFPKPPLYSSCSAVEFASLFTPERKQSEENLCRSSTTSASPWTVSWLQVSSVPRQPPGWSTRPLLSALPHHFFLLYWIILMAISNITISPILKNILKFPLTLLILLRHSHVWPFCKNCLQSCCPYSWSPLLSSHSFLSQPRRLALLSAKKKKNFIKVTGDLDSA